MLDTCHRRSELFMTLEKINTVPNLPARPRDSHKGRFGSVLIVAGSRGMAGAAALCGGAALRSGAGLVTVATPSEIQPTVSSFEPSYMTYPLPCDENGLIQFGPAKSVLERLIGPASVVAVGPGLGQSDDIRQLVAFLIAEVDKPLVIDADGLNALVGQSDLLSQRKNPVVLTPHPGEFARLTNSTIAQVQSDRVQRAVALAKLSGELVVVLKGAGTVVTDGGRYYINTTGNPGMATGGTGDVLTGVITALLAQKLPPFDAAQLGVFIHGLSGDIARDQSGEIGLIAGDLVDALPDAFVHAMPDPDPISISH
jgi:ADP-dependent NAD(P)H-hydrate dehydratase